MKKIFSIVMAMVAIAAVSTSCSYDKIIASSDGKVKLSMTIDDNVQNVLDDFNDDAGHGAEGKGAEQRGQVGDVQLDERGHQRNGELDEHQKECHSGEHGDLDDIGGGEFAFHGFLSPFFRKNNRPTEIRGRHHFSAKQENFDHLLPSRLYCRFRNCTGSCALLKRRSRTVTAGREFHPALKISVWLSGFSIA